MTSLPQRISLVFLLLFNISTLFAEPQNLGLLKNELIHYHDDGEYEKEFNTVVCKAQHYIDKRAAQNNQRGNKQKLAIVLDIDETSLSNYRSMSEHNFSITRTGFAREILKSRGAVFASMLQLFQDAQRHNITVFL